MRASIHATQRPAERPLGLAILSISGVVFGLALGLLVVSWAAVRTLSGTPASQALIAALLVLLLALTIVWLYWGLWEMVPSAWWTHIILGPLLVLALALALLTQTVPALVALAAGALPEAARPPAERAASGALLALMGLQGATIGYLPSVRRTFGIGVPKRAWER
ncbi:MAG TPA: hypothetical protein VNL77_03035 [Roseiflexaceae bacterium]|nr:hypothetical protein [Roseiflexaceae bacterium]